MTTADEHPVKRGDELALLEAAAAEPTAALALLPWLAAAIDADAAAGRFDAWGLSTVVDENTGGAVISKPLFDALHDRASIPARFPVGNAGLLHVYGYLLSTTPTPYGLKRERWLDGSLPVAYGLAPTAFLPWADAAEGTPLRRVTAAATSLLAAGTVRQERIGEITAHIAIGRRAASGPSALAYALTRDGATRLVTTFPIASPDAVLAAVAQEAPRLRWNAVA